MKIISFVLLLLSVAEISGANEPDYEAERRNYACGEETQRGVRFSYCIRKLEYTNSNDVVYYLHGLNSSEKTWYRHLPGTGLVQMWWNHYGYNPRIVSISFGPEWLLVDNKKLSLLSYFTKVAMPVMEKKIGGLKNGKRHIIGLSMGGYNGAVLALKNPQLFSRVALLCPAITTVGPYSDPDDIEEYIQRTGAHRSWVRKMLRISRSIFINQKDWDRFDPLELISKYRSAKKLKFYVTVGMEDGFGFQEGAEEFYHLADGDSTRAYWGPVPGGHCNFNRKETAKFIMGDPL